MQKAVLKQSDRQTLETSNFGYPNKTRNTRIPENITRVDTDVLKRIYSCVLKWSKFWTRLETVSRRGLSNVNNLLKFDTMNVSEIFSILHKLWHVTSHRVKCFAKKCSHGRKLHIFAIPFRSHRGTIVRQEPRKCCTEPKGTWCKYFRKRAYLQGNKEHKQLKANVLSSLMQSLAFYHRTKKKNSSYPRTSSSLTSMHRNSNQPLLHLTRTAACTSRTHTRK